jgi:hypothetical protein
MVCLYLPAFLTSLAVSSSLHSENAELFATPPNYSSALCVLHFAKRLFETLFVHKYSGNMDIGMVISGSIYYAVAAGCISLYAKPLELTSTPSILGLSAYGFGILGNLYHHYLLAQLRKGDRKIDDEDKYVVPRGGLFEYVACPHYFCEIIELFGISIYSRTSLSYAIALVMTSYLAGRAKSTTAYYKQRLGDVYPSNRKNLIPFIW